MAKAFAFWQMPEEESKFLDFLDTTGTVVAYPDHWVRTEAEASAQPLRVYLTESNPRQVFLGLQPEPPSVVIGTKTEGIEQFLYVDLMASCLIAYSRPCYRTTNRLGKSNLAAYFDFLKDDAMQSKPEWFHSWVKQVFTWAKKHAKKKCVHQRFSYPATPLVLKLVEEKQIEVVH